MKPGVVGQLDSLEALRLARSNGWPDLDLHDVVGFEYADAATAESYMARNQAGGLTVAGPFYLDGRPVSLIYTLFGTDHLAECTMSVAPPELPIRPDYYNGANGMQPLDVIDAFGLDFYEGNVVKYLLRWRRKDGVADLRKARTYLGLLIERAERESA